MNGGGEEGKTEVVVVERGEEKENGWNAVGLRRQRRRLSVRSTGRGNVSEES